MLYPNLVIFWFFVCVGVHFFSLPILRTIFPSIPPPRQKSPHEWTNHCTSLFHATVMSVLFIVYWSDVLALPPSESSIGGYEWNCMDIMVGYLIYDFIFEIFSFLKSLKATGKKKRINWASFQILFHHVLGLASHWSQQMLDCGVGSRYMMGIYGAELSTPFLHMMWLLTESNMKKSKAYFYCGCALIAMFMFRNALGFYIMFHLVTNWPLWIDSTTHNSTVNIDAIMYNAHVIITAFFVMLNLLWTSKLLKKAFG